MSGQNGRVRAALGAFFLLLIGTVVGITLVSELRLMPVGRAINEKPTEAPVEIFPTDQVFVRIAKKVTPAVVNISTTRVVHGGGSELPFNDPFFKRFFGDQSPFGRQHPRSRKEQSLGSGVIVSSDGLIITNSHVIEEADSITVFLEDKRDFKGVVVGKDKKSDIAVIRIEADDLPTIPWGDSDKLQVGEYVVAVGNPFGLNQTVTMGIVSAVGRANVGIADYEDFIQTDAAINPGNSGGAMVNINAELVGINTAIFTRSGGYMGIGFAAPSNMARSVMESLVKNGKVVRGWLGVSIQEVTPLLAKEFGLKEASGALVSDIMKDSPAEKTGIKREDVIVGFNGQHIENAGHLRNKVAGTSVGKKVSVRIIRNREEIELFVTITAQPKDVSEGTESSESEESGEVLFGMEAQDITRELADQLGLRKGDMGVVVVGIEPGSLSDEAGVREGDLITQVNRRPIRDMKTYKKVISTIKEGDTVLLLINRQGSLFFLTITPER
jgi:serine protease Do